ncbi:terminase large subunit domain-containing protein [Bradyrhizobium pachyrhizi]|uniref:terminase large subunit domain-containing protein n=1 Tax=Bradyrhizobium pachyrhizi TaxID=280333 RepID=UPI003D35D4B8
MTADNPNVVKRPRGRPKKRNGPNALESCAPNTGGQVFRSHSLKKSGEKTTAEKVIEFLETLKIPEGPLAGQQLRLAEFQKRFVRGALEPANMVGVLSIGRGNAKTALSAGIALACLMSILDSQPKREIILAARNRDQAKIAFNFLVGFVESLPEEEQALFKVRRGQRLEVEYSGNGGGLARCIAADGKSVLGGAPNLAILDERAAWDRDKGDSLENSILSGLGKRGGRALIISTSAPDDANTFSRWLDDPPPGTYVQEHRPPFGLPADDAESLLTANPGAAEGIGSSLEWLQAQARRAIARGGSALSSFRNLNRNERVSTEDRSVLVTVDEWLSSEVSELPPRRGVCILGVDLGGSRSMSAASFYWPETGRLEAIGTFPTVPSLADRGASDGVSGRYVEMKERSELTTLGENTVPAGPWLADIVSRVDCPISCIVGDRFRHAEFVEAMQKAGLSRVPFIWRGFGWKDGAEDIERFRKTLFNGNVKSLPSLLLRSAFADAITLVDPAGNHKLAKARSLGRIDAAAATILAVAQGDRVLARPASKARAAVWA